ncbi:MAG: hypothetical protein ABJB40_06035, partial [Acidobacteriota bacterium]
MVDSTNPDGNLVGIEISSDGLSAVVLGSNGEIAAARAAAVGDAENSTAELISLVEELKSEFGAFNTIGLAVPGLVDR